MHYKIALELSANCPEPHAAHVCCGREMTLYAHPEGLRDHQCAHQCQDNTNGALKARPTWNRDRSISRTTPQESSHGDISATARVHGQPAFATFEPGQPFDGCPKHLLRIDPAVQRKTAPIAAANEAQRGIRAREQMYGGVL